MKIHTLSIVGILIISLVALCNGDCPIKYKGIKGHTACISRSSDYVSGGVSKSEAEEIVKLHNEYRAAVNPPACMMLKMYWNEDLAYVAQKWAENCEFAHDANNNRRIPGVFSVGQNAAKQQTSWAQVLSNWHGEVKDFTYGQEATKEIGHYTAMVWAKTGFVGCGFAQCTNFRLYVCNYGPSGNLKGQLPTPYPKCDSPTPLKDCKGKICKNDGKFQDDSCECKCIQSPQISGPECDLDCAVADRKIPCTLQSEADCSKYSNLPSNCPQMCHICPYATQKDPDTPSETTTVKTSTNPTTTQLTTTKPTTTKAPSGSCKYSPMYPLVLAVLFLPLMM